MGLRETAHLQAAAPRGERREISIEDGVLEMSSGLLPDEPDEEFWRGLAAEWGYELDDWVLEDADSLRVGGHESAAVIDNEWVTQKLRNFKVRLRRRVDGHTDLSTLLEYIRGRKPRGVWEPKTEAAFVVFLSDWQIGKGDGDGTFGDGTDPLALGSVGRIMDAFEEKLRRIRFYRPAVVALPSLGDLVENCFGFYSDQPNRIDLTVREQMDVAAALLLWMIEQVVALGVPDVRVSAVPSNHGERRQGKQQSATDVFRDNLDLQLLDRVTQAIRMNDRYQHVGTYAPTGRHPSTTILPLDGLHLATHHGHFRGPSRRAVKGGGPRMTTILNWWVQSHFSEQGAAHCDMLAVGHGHHLLLDHSTMRPALQVPAMDGGSEWFSENTGVASPAGMVSMLFGGTVARPGFPYSDLDID